MSNEMLACAVAFLVALAGVPVASRIAVRVGAVVHPRADRWARRPVPILGGLAIAAGLAVGVPLALVTTDPLAVALVVGGGAVMLTLGLLDDFRSLTPARRLLCEVGLGAVSGVVIFGVGSPLAVACILVSTVAVPAVVNATNLVDNADGLSGSLSAVTALFIAAMAVANGMNGSEVAIGTVTVAVCVAYLVFNVPPARVFMGDTGSLVLGFVLAVAGLYAAHDALFVASPADWIAAAAVPLAFAAQGGDMVMVVLTRRARGVSPFQGGVDHTSHRLRRLGASPWGMLAIVVLVAVATAALGLLAILFAPGPVHAAVLIAAAALLVVGFETVVVITSPRPAPPAAGS